MNKVALLKTILLLLAGLSGGWQCQSATESPPPPPTVTPLPTPPPALVIEAGDGSDLLDRLLARGILRVGIRVWPEVDFSPPAFRGIRNAAIGGALTGPEIELAHLLAEGMQLELELVEAYPPIIAGGDWRGEWDIALASLTPFDQPAANTPEQPLRYSIPYAYMPLGVLLPLDSDGIQTLANLENRRVGVLEESAYQRLFTALPEPLTVAGQPLITAPPTTLTVVPLSNLQKSIRQFSQPDGPDGDINVEALVGPAPIFQEAITTNNLPLRLLVDAENSVPLPLAVATVPQDDLSPERLLNAINNILELLHRRGILAEIYTTWYGQDYSRPPADPR